MTTVQCPSCGASATNFKNCEYCGSLFVRYLSQEIDSKNLFNGSDFKGFIFPGLREALNKNLELQKLTPGRFIVTDILKGQAPILQVVPSSQVQDLLRGSHISDNGVAIHLPFTDDNKGSEFQNFLKLDEYKLFTHSTHNGFDEFCIDFGSDATGASYLCSKILINIYSINSDQLLVYKTSDYDAVPTENTSSNGSCFVATAAMGSYDHPHVVELRKFRDNWILKRPGGIKFVNWYYKYGSIAAKMIEKSFMFRKFCYFLIVKPLVIIARMLNKTY